MNRKLFTVLLSVLLLVGCTNQDKGFFSTLESDHIKNYITDKDKSLNTGTINLSEVLINYKTMSDIPNDYKLLTDEELSFVSDVKQFYKLFLSLSKDENLINHANYIGLPSKDEKYVRGIYVYEFFNEISLDTDLVNRINEYEANQIIHIIYKDNIIILIDPSVINNIENLKKDINEILDNQKSGGLK